MCNYCERTNILFQNKFQRATIESVRIKNLTFSKNVTTKIQVYIEKMESVYKRHSISTK